MSSIETVDLTKRFGDVTAVDSLNLRVESGEVFGLLGPNGAGKTTTLSILCTILKPTSGSASVNGHGVTDEPSDVRKSIGIVFQDPSLDNRLTGRENMEMHAELYNVDRHMQKKRIKELLELVELTSRADEPVKNYSGGMKRRLEIARGLIHRPNILFLDEPTLGLDPQTRGKIWEYIRKLPSEENITIVLTTHYMEEAEMLCDRVGIIDHGRIVALGQPRQLIKDIGEDIVSLKLGDKSRAEAFKQLSFVKNVKVGETVRLVVEDGAEATPRICEFATQNNIKLRSLELRTPTLNDVFLYHVGRELREENANSRDRMKSMMRRRGGR
ncbi:MAG: ATP-binding cassette domain-containing protein [Candidatus Altiarchaeales archaeon]|nr:ATP-binding cassette domain-containing protein [Candidatus Altiarchaeales archaeon]MBD3416479.1 ATP-binding cassette domain-containing protein [Candidatus Altiarchaeales archaeon]